MNGTLKIDLRKSDPLGLDFSLAYLRVKTAVDEYKRMGPGDAKKPGWYEHERVREAKGRVIVDFVALAKIIAQALGEERAMQVPGLKFALEFRGLANL